MLPPAMSPSAVFPRMVVVKLDIVSRYFFLMSRPAMSPPAMLSLIVVEFFDLSTINFSVQPASKPPRKDKISERCSMHSPVFCFNLFVQTANP